MIVKSKSIWLRRWVSENIPKESEVVNLENVEFINRAACDELLTQCSEYNIDIEGESGEVAEMISELSEDKSM